MIKKLILFTSLSLTALVAKDIEKQNYKFGGRVDFDYSYIDDSKDSYSQGEVRRVRLFLKGKFLEDFKYEVEYDTASNNGFKDLYLAYKISPNITIKAGQTKEPFGLENLTSSKYESFMEGSLISTFAHKRRVGLLAESNYKFLNHTLTGGIGYFRRSINDMIDENEDSVTYSGRLTYAFTPSKERVFHIGFSASQSEFNERKLKYKTDLNSHVYRGSVIKSKVKNVDKTKRYQSELAMIFGPFSFESEYSTLSANSINDYDFDGWYAQFGYFLTGEHKNYKRKSATFKQVKINNPFEYGDGGYGAVELALRVSGIDLTRDALDKKREELDTTFGVNWYLRDDMRIITNYTTAKIEGKDDEYSIGSRVEFIF
jgi:phosphate-selective porin OprO/OprP